MNNIEDIILNKIISINNNIFKKIINNFNNNNIYYNIIEILNIYKKNKEKIDINDIYSILNEFNFLNIILENLEDIFNNTIDNIINKEIKEIEELIKNTNIIINNENIIHNEDIIDKDNIIIENIKKIESYLKEKKYKEIFNNIKDYINNDIKLKIILEIFFYNLFIHKEENIIFENIIKDENIIDFYIKKFRLLNEKISENNYNNYNELEQKYINEYISNININTEKINRTNNILLDKKILLFNHIYYLIFILNKYKDNNICFKGIIYLFTLLYIFIKIKEKNNNFLFNIYEYKNNISYEILFFDNLLFSYNNITNLYTIINKKINENKELFLNLIENIKYDNNLIDNNSIDNIIKEFKSIQLEKIRIEKEKKERKILIPLPRKLKTKKETKIKKEIILQPLPRKLKTKKETK
jgi:hypothetical protein